MIAGFTSGERVDLRKIHKYMKDSWTVSIMTILPIPVIWAGNNKRFLS